MHSLKWTVIVGPLVLLVALAGQQPAAPASERGEGFPIDRVLRSPGELLTRGQNEQPAGKLRVKSYRLERVKLDKPFLRGDGKTQQYEYRLVIKRGTFYPRVPAVD